MLASEARKLDERGWHGRLRLGFEPRGQRTAIVRRSHVGPLCVQRPFYPEADGTCHVYVLHPPGGVVGGDELELELVVGEGAQVLATTPAATKLYRSSGATARVDNRIEVKRGGVLEWLPGETIAFGGSAARVSTSIALEPGGRFLGWEITCLGRPASGDEFVTGLLDQRTELFVGGAPLVLDRMLTDGAGAFRKGAWGWAGHTVHGLLLATGASSELTAELLQSVRLSAPGQFGRVRDEQAVLLVRGQAHSSRSCHGPR